MEDKLVAVPGSVPTNPHEKIGAVDATERIEVLIKLRRKTEEGLPSLEEFLAGKRASLTRQDLSDKYGSSREDADAVRTWAGGQGLSISRIDLSSRDVHLVGSAAAVSKAFGVKLSKYRHARTGTEFRCPEGNIQIPQSLTSIIVGVFGLTDMPMAFRGRGKPTAMAATGNPKTDFPGSFFPNEVSALYNFPPTTGKGQKVAVLEFGGGLDQTVLASYFSQNIGLNPTPTVNAISVMNTVIQVDQNVTGEVYLDIEVIGAMAPEAVIDVYFAPWSGQGYLAAINQAIQNDDYAAISISYGLDEDATGNAQNPGWTMLHQNLDQAFQDAVAIGVPVFISSGDQGSSSLRGQQNGQEVTTYGPSAHGGYPSTSPYVTSVGGTMLYAEGGAITQEVVWNELGALQGNSYYLGGATGGGVSDRYTTVPSYQTQAGLNPKSVNTPPVTGRGVPDVAGNAGATTGYLVSQPPGSQYPIAPVGGTSAAAPMWAALMACVRESLTTALNGKIPVYFFNDFAYAKGTTAAFRDIVGGRTITYDQNGAVLGPFIPIGNNRSSKADGYYAAQGYDLCTGWGSPNGVELLNQLQSWLATKQ